MKTIRKIAVNMVINFYIQIAGSYDVEYGFKEPQLTQARKCALLHLDMTDSPDL